jgi:hypothetical protein
MDAKIRWTQVLQEVKNPPKRRDAEVATKSGAKYHYKYASLDDVLEVVKPVLEKHELALEQEVYTDDFGRLALATRIVDCKTGEIVKQASELAVPMPDDMHDLGKAVSYMRKYALAPLFGVAAEEDKDANVQMRTRRKAEQPPQPTLAKELAELIAEFDAAGKKAALAKALGEPKTQKDALKAYMALSEEERSALRTLL